MHIRKLFDKLRQEKLLTNPKKCSFVKKELVYVGFVFLGKGMKMDIEKVKVKLE